MAWLGARLAVSGVSGGANRVAQARSPAEPGEPAGAGAPADPGGPAGPGEPADPGGPAGPGGLGFRLIAARPCRGRDG
jgi:hypothetical protein